MPPKDLTDLKSRENPAAAPDAPDLSPEDIGKMPSNEREALLVYGVLRIATAVEDLVAAMEAASNPEG